MTDHREHAMIRRLTLALVALLAAAALAAPAQSATRHESTEVVNGDLCTNRGVTNYYVHHWQRVPVRKILDSPYVFHEHKCSVNGFRLYKSSSDTAAEVTFARHFLKTDRPKKPTIFCRTTPGHAYFLDLGFYWGVQGWDHLNAAEQHHYAGWAHDYARRHGCRLFTP